MWLKIILGLIAVLSATAIRVPVDEEEENGSDPVRIPANDSPNKFTYFSPADDKMKAYLNPHDSQRHAEVIVDVIPKPLTYLLPPLTNTQSEFRHQGSGSGQQSDWYPITQLNQNAPNVLPIILQELNETEAHNLFETMRNGKSHHEQVSLPTPSTKLEPPAPNAPNDYIIVAPEELEVPKYKTVFKQKPIVAYKSILSKYKTPTKFYPKKYADGFQPIPIPVSQFADDASDEIPKARPSKPFHPVLGNGEFSTTDDKKIYDNEESEKIRKLNEENSAEKPHPTLNGDVKPPIGEQQSSESHISYPQQNVYFSPTHHDPPRQAEFQNKEHMPPPAGERTEFRMHGMKGPHSYQFGFDTGKGKNRQFRYEERDNDGRVRGHYGYMDRNGKLRVVNYDADPEHGFRAEAPVEKDQ